MLPNKVKICKKLEHEQKLKLELEKIKDQQSESLESLKQQMEKSEEIIAEESQKRKQLESQLVDYDKLKKRFDYSD